MSRYGAALRADARIAACLGRRLADTLMPLRESEAVVLRSYPLGEADRLVSLLGRASGRLRGVARGARRPRSRFGSTLETLSYIRIWYFERETRELVRINQCELIESFLEAQRDYQRGLGLALLSEVTEAVLPEREPAEGMFRLLLHTARGLKRGVDVPLALAYFSLWTVRLAGWLAELDRCARCGRKLQGEAGFASGTHAGLACVRCRVPGMKALRPETLALGRAMLEQRLEEVGAAQMPAAAGELGEYMLDTIEHQAERTLQTRRILGAGLREPV